ncbi:hypothetical protein CEB3_c08870 [Peptococcaceae bacterium CEB3]|nr:hypothetical protein CEB3_c08870 [Peptococcaceae bacterium CEB3]
MRYIFWPKSVSSNEENVRLMYRPLIGRRFVRFHQKPLRERDLSCSLVGYTLNQHQDKCWDTDLVAHWVGMYAGERSVDKPFAGLGGPSSHLLCQNRRRQSRAGDCRGQGILPGGESHGSHKRPAAYLESLERISVLPAKWVFPAHHSLDIQPEILIRMRDVFRQLKQEGKLHHGSGTFHYGDWTVWPLGPNAHFLRSHRCKSDDVISTPYLSGSL